MPTIPQQWWAFLVYSSGDPPYRRIARPARAPAVLRSLGRLAFLFLLGSLDQLLNGLVQLFVTWGTHVLMPDDALVVDDVKRRPAANIPFGGNRPAGALLSVPEGSPGNLLLFQDGLQVLEIR